MLKGKKRYFRQVEEYRARSRAQGGAMMVEYAFAMVFAAFIGALLVPYLYDLGVEVLDSTVQKISPHYP